jgi:hypothetical protein
MDLNDFYAILVYSLLGMFLAEAVWFSVMLFKTRKPKDGQKVQD